MARYITQQLFDMCAVSAAKISAANSTPLAEVSKQLAETYSQSYNDDNLPQEISVAAEQIAAFVSRVLPPVTLVGNLTQLQFCIKNFQPNGKRWPMKLLSGALFNKSSRPLPDKVRQSLANVATYHVLVINGAIPLAPTGWKL